MRGKLSSVDLTSHGVEGGEVESVLPRGVSLLNIFSELSPKTGRQTDLGRRDETLPYAAVGGPSRKPPPTKAVWFGRTYDPLSKFRY